NMQYPASQLSVGRWTLDVGRLPRLCRGKTSRLPSPSDRSSWNESGAGDGWNRNLEKSCRRKRELASHGRSSIASKHKASSRTVPWRERPYMTSGWRVDHGSSANFPTLRGFLCSLSFSMHARIFPSKYTRRNTWLEN